SVAALEDSLARVDILGKAISLPAAFPVTPATPVIAMLRPEALSLHDNPTLPQALVEQAMYLGSEVEYLVNLNDQILTIVDNDPRTNRVFEEGQHVGVDFVDEAVH